MASKIKQLILEKYFQKNKVLANKDASPFLCCFVVVVVVVVVVICHYGGHSICCCGCVDAKESSSVTPVHYSSDCIGKPIYFTQFKEYFSDGRMDGQTDGLTV